MLTRSFDRAMIEASGQGRGLTPADIGGLPFRLGYESVPPGAEAGPREATAGEVLLVLSGTGSLTGPSGERRAVTRGDAVYTAGTEYGLSAEGGTALDFVRAQWSLDDSGGGAPIAVRSFDRTAMDWAYEMHLQHLYDAEDIPGLPFGSVFGSVPAHSVSKYHCHQDGEIFLILSGRAEVLLGTEAKELGPGDLVFLTPFDFHGIRNASDEPFDLASFYWEEIAVAAAELAARHPRQGIAQRVVVSCPPPTPNGDLHLGHLAGPYLRADMYVRALRTLGRHADLVTGTDDHQSYVAAKARRRGAGAAELATAAGDRIVATLETAGFRATRLYRPLRDEGHEERMRRRFAALASAPTVTAGTVDTPWCAACEQSLYQAFANGSCPHCGKGCDGEICEDCGNPNDARDLLGLKCALCGAAPTLRPEPALVLHLDSFAAQLRSYLGRLEGDGGLRLLVQRLLDAGLDDYRLTRCSSWGIALDGELSGHVIDPWVELALTHLEETERAAGNGEVTPVTFLGYDNSFYYAVLMPAIAFADGREEALPRGFVANRFLHLDGAKLSTSRGHAVWGDETLAKTPADFVRLALLRRSPEDAVVDITTVQASTLAEDPLLGPLRNWIDGFAGLPGAGVVPGTGAWSVAHREFYRAIGLQATVLDSLLVVDGFSSVGYVETLESLVRGALRFRAAEQTRRELADKREEARTSVALEYLAAKAFSALCYPVLPVLGAALWSGLGLPGAPVREGSWSFIPGGTRTRLAVPDELAASWPTAGAA